MMQYLKTNKKIQLSKTLDMRFYCYNCTP